MKLLWIGKAATNGRAGDEVFDRRMIDAIGQLGPDIVHVAPTPTTLARQACGILGGKPHNRALYDTPGNRARIQEAAAGCEAAVISWEPFDCFASVLSLPVIAVLHNVTSQSLMSARPGSLAAMVLARIARSWEQRRYAQDGGLIAIAALSRADENLLRAVHASPILYTPPGMPPVVPLAGDSIFIPEICIDGTYDWSPKRRDLDLFAQEYRIAGRDERVLASNLPSSAARYLRPSPTGNATSAIRFGLITDRFKSGFKLKSTAYIAQNCIVLSYADILEDFASIPDASFFVRRIRHARDIDRHRHAIAEVPVQELRARLATFQAHCATEFSWQSSAERLLAPFGAMIAEGRRALRVPHAAA